MSDEIQPDPHCAVCERRLLPGERPIEFMTRDGAAVLVCELCKPRAEQAGWLRPDEHEALRGAVPPRDRRRARGANAFGGLLSRFGGPAEDPDEDEEAAAAVPAAPAPAADYDYDEDPLEATIADAPQVAASIAVPEALYAFNNSDHRRTVAGLSRTLGPPRATALEIKNGGGQQAIRLTIAWELTWYQWEVVLSGRGFEVRESGKGDTIDQLRTADRTWNLMVDADGTLQQKVAPAATPDE